MTYMRFDEIVDSISVEQMENPPLSNSREQNIAFLARSVANAHVGWNSFPENIRNKFRQNIEELYNRAPAPDENILKEMEALLIRSIPDNHTFILDKDKQKILDEQEAQNISDKLIDKYPETSVGKNMAYSSEKYNPEDVLCYQSNGKHPISIMEKTENGKKIGIVSLSKCPQPSDTSYDLEKFSGIFDNNYQKWDAVVLDVRGNEGGNSRLIEHISEKLYGTLPAYLRTQEMRMTPEAKILQAQKIKSREFLDMLYAQNPNGYKSKPRKETAFCEEKGFNKNIYVLMDRRTSSSAEFVCGLYNHPKIKYLGENSCGCGEYGDTGQLRLPNGGYLNMGIYKNESFCKIKEGEGFSPTHPTKKGQDAFEHCLQVMQNDFHLQKVKDQLAKKEKAIQQSFGLSPVSGVSYKTQTTKINPDILHLCQNKNQIR